MIVKPECNQSMQARMDRRQAKLMDEQGVSCPSTCSTFAKPPNNNQNPSVGLDFGLIFNHAIKATMLSEPLESQPTGLYNPKSKLGFESQSEPLQIQMAPRSMRPNFYLTQPAEKPAWSGWLSKLYKLTSLNLKQAIIYIYAHKFPQGSRRSAISMTIWDKQTHLYHPSAMLAQLQSQDIQVTSLAVVGLSALIVGTSDGCLVLCPLGGSQAQAQVEKISIARIEHMQVLPHKQVTITQKQSITVWQLGHVCVLTSSAQIYLVTILRLQHSPTSAPSLHMFPQQKLSTPATLPLHGPGSRLCHIPAPQGHGHIVQVTGAGVVRVWELQPYARCYRHCGNERHQLGRCLVERMKGIWAEAAAKYEDLAKEEPKCKETMEDDGPDGEGSVCHIKIKSSDMQMVDQGAGQSALGDLPTEEPPSCPQSPQCCWQNSLSPHSLAIDVANCSPSEFIDFTISIHRPTPPPPPRVPHFPLNFVCHPTLTFTCLLAPHSALHLQAWGHLLLCIASNGCLSLTALDLAHRQREHMQLYETLLQIQVFNPNKVQTQEPQSMSLAQSCPLPHALYQVSEVFVSLRVLDDNIFVLLLRRYESMDACHYQWYIRRLIISDQCQILAHEIIIGQVLTHQVLSFQLVLHKQVIDTSTPTRQAIRYYNLHMFTAEGIVHYNSFVCLSKSMFYDLNREQRMHQMSVRRIVSASQAACRTYL